MAKKHLLSSFILSETDDEGLKDYFAKDKRFWRYKDVRLVLKRLAEDQLHAGHEVLGAELVQEFTTT